MQLTEANRNAIKKASKIKCKVHLLPNRSYLVTTPTGHRYTVRILVQHGERYALCNCAAGAIGMACYHLPFAALIDDLTSYAQKPAERRRAA